MDMQTAPAVGDGRSLAGVGTAKTLAEPGSPVQTDATDPDVDTNTPCTCILKKIDVKLWACNHNQMPLNCFILFRILGSRRVLHPAPTRQAGMQTASQITIVGLAPF